jgi:hypothetical protein
VIIREAKVTVVAIKQTINDIIVVIASLLEIQHIKDFHYLKFSAYLYLLHLQIGFLIFMVHYFSDSHFNLCLHLIVVISKNSNFSIICQF